MKTKKRLGLSDLAFSLLHLSSTSANREELVKKAALRPTLIAEVFERLPSGSDAAIKDFLLEEKNFNPASVDFFCRDVQLSGCTERQ